MGIHKVAITVLSWCLGPFESNVTVKLIIKAAPVLRRLASSVLANMEVQGEISEQKFTSGDIYADRQRRC